MYVCECRVCIHTHVCTGLVQLIVQLLIGVLGPEWAVWRCLQVSQGSGLCLPWCLVHVVWVVAHSKVAGPGGAGSPPSSTVRGWKDRCGLCRAQGSPSSRLRKRLQVALAGA